MTDMLPAFVRDEPRYVQRGEDTWHLDGIDWHTAPAPVESGHEHWAQSVGWLGLALICRCPCSAMAGLYSGGWLRMDAPRLAEPAPSMWRRVVGRWAAS